MSRSQISIDVHLSDAERRAVLEEDARSGLSGRLKQLSPVWFYDERGSRLFEDITRLPEYYLTRAERRLLGEHAPQIARCAAADTLVELGSGSSEKTRLLIDAMIGEGSIERYVPLDVSEAALREAAASVAADYPELRVHAVVGDFHRHVQVLPGGGPRLFAFLGSTIGNLPPPERHRFLAGLARAMAPDDRLLLGVDLLKDVDRLTAAYDDVTGVSAAFNLNALSVLNRELDANFQPDRFSHVARWNPEERWMEMRLRATVAQTVDIRSIGLRLAFEEQEEILTEISAKFTIDQISSELGETGFTVEQMWVDQADGFALVLGALH